ncbi:hypothetical protein [Robertmurraya massiliosenegalensis]|uniref:hypothetical protein n=1 Tax=Robertmurraya massiliosenegalensis TaxID=1287657 RepID=UPI00031C152F|nr:hypothetical protein [Robertmurraya massiliosenegalensis]
MENIIERIIQELEQAELQKYWPGFEKVAYAVYNETEVTIFNHPKFKHQEKLKRDAHFNACTLIMYEDYPTAIVDLQFFEKFEDLYSILVHELFHGYQYLKGEKRFPDEMKGVTYPVSGENVELRNLERLNLFHALVEKDPAKKKEYLQAFVSLREQRAIAIDEHLTYENLIETVEGPAWYVEMRAYYEKSGLEFSTILRKYGEPLKDPYQSTIKVRMSCYSSGLFMCVLLDELSPKWKETFFNAKKTIYDYIKECSDIDITQSYRLIEISSETKKIVDSVIKNKEEKFTAFNEQEGIHLTIVGKIIATAFDPMNIVMLDRKVLHQNFLKIRIHDEEYLLQQPVVTKGEGLRQMRELHLRLRSELVIRKSSLFIDGIGEIKGKVEKKGEHFYLNIR